MSMIDHYTLIGRFTQGFFRLETPSLRIPIGSSI